MNNSAFQPSSCAFVRSSIYWTFSSPGGLEVFSCDLGCSWSWSSSTVGQAFLQEPCKSQSHCESMTCSHVAPSQYPPPPPTPRQSRWSSTHISQRHHQHVRLLAKQIWSTEGISRRAVHAPPLLIHTVNRTFESETFAWQPYCSQTDKCSKHISSFSQIVIKYIFLRWKRFELLRFRVQTCNPDGWIVRQPDF